MRSAGMGGADMLEDLAEPGLLSLQAGAVVGDAGLRVKDGELMRMYVRTTELGHKIKALVKN